MCKTLHFDERELVNNPGTKRNWRRGSETGDVTLPDILLTGEIRLQKYIIN